MGPSRSGSAIVNVRIVNVRILRTRSSSAANTTPRSNSRSYVPLGPGTLRNRCAKNGVGVGGRGIAGITETWMPAELKSEAQ